MTKNGNTNSPILSPLPTRSFRFMLFLMRP
jgi:hypothetical protein